MLECQLDTANRKQKQPAKEQNEKVNTLVIKYNKKKNGKKEDSSAQKDNVKKIESLCGVNYNRESFAKYFGRSVDEIKGTHEHE